MSMEKRSYTISNIENGYVLAYQKARRVQTPTGEATVGDETHKFFKDRNDLYDFIEIQETRWDGPEQGEPSIIEKAKIIDM